MSDETADLRQVRSFNEQNIAEFRANGGKVGGASKASRSFC